MGDDSDIDLNILSCEKSENPELCGKIFSFLKETNYLDIYLKILDRKRRNIDIIPRNIITKNDLIRRERRERSPRRTRKVIDYNENLDDEDRGRDSKRVPEKVPKDEDFKDKPYITICNNYDCFPEIKDIDRNCDIEYYNIGLSGDIDDEIIMNYLRIYKYNLEKRHRIIEITKQNCMYVNEYDNIYVDLWKRLQLRQKINTLDGEFAEILKQFDIIMTLNEKLQPSVQQTILIASFISDRKYMVETLLGRFLLLPFLFNPVSKKKFKRWSNIRKRSLALIEQIKKRNTQSLYLMDGHGRFLFDFMEVNVLSQLKINVVELDENVYNWHLDFFPGRVKNHKKNIFGLEYKPNRYFYFNFCGIGAKNILDIKRWIDLRRNFMLSFSHRQNGDFINYIEGLESLTSMRGIKITRIDPSRRNFLTYTIDFDSSILGRN